MGCLQRRSIIKSLILCIVFPFWSKMSQNIKFPYFWRRLFQINANITMVHILFYKKFYFIYFICFLTRKLANPKYQLRTLVFKIVLQTALMCKIADFGNRKYIRDPWNAITWSKSDCLGRRFRQNRNEIQWTPDVKTSWHWLSTQNTIFGSTWKYTPTMFGPLTYSKKIFLPKFLSRMYTQVS